MWENIKKYRWSICIVIDIYLFRLYDPFPFTETFPFNLKHSMRYINIWFVWLFWHMTFWTWFICWQLTCSTFLTFDKLVNFDFLYVWCYLHLLTLLTFCRKEFVNWISYWDVRHGIDGILGLGIWYMGKNK